MDFRQQWKRKISRQKQLQKDEGEKTLEEKETKNKFWKGVLVGALVMAFAGLIIVGVSSGIFLIGRAVIDNRAQVEQTERIRNWIWNLFHPK